MDKTTAVYMINTIDDASARAPPSRPSLGLFLSRPELPIAESVLVTKAMPFPFNFKSLDFLISCFAGPRPRNAPCYLDRLPNDMLVDQVFTYLDVFDILCLRQVSKLYFYITHHTAIWKRLLQRTDLPLPPLAPTSRHSLENLIGFEAERVVLRATSLDRCWKSLKPQYKIHWHFPTFHHIQSMVLLPGSQYLVASVSDQIQCTCFIVIYAMDNQLYAKYMTVQGERGIVISYVHRDYKHVEDMSSGININTYSADYKIDSAVPLEYKCITIHISLSSLDILSDPRFVPGSEEFLAHAKAQPPPFRLLATVRTRSVLGSPALDEIFGSPYLAVPKGSNMIVFKKLDGGPAVTLHCNATNMGPIQEHSIVAIRLVSAGDKVLVVRKIAQADPALAIEYFNVIPPDPNKAEFHRSHIDAIYLKHLDPATVKISDHGIPTNDDDSVVSSLYGRPEAFAPRPISIFATTRTDQVLVRFTLFPRYHAPPPTPLSASSVTPYKPLTHAGAYATYSYPLPSTCKLSRLSWRATGVEPRVLPGSYRAIVYTVPAGDRTDAPPVVDYYRYFDPRSRSVQAAAEVAAAEAAGQPKPRVAVHLITPAQLTAMRSVRALAWDETVGRLCICGGNGTKVHVVDFAKAPTEMFIDDKVERWPVPIQLNPNPDDIVAPLPLTPRRSSDGEDVIMDML